MKIKRKALQGSKVVPACIQIILILTIYLNIPQKYYGTHGTHAMHNIDCIRDWDWEGISNGAAPLEDIRIIIMIIIIILVQR